MRTTLQEDVCVCVCVGGWVGGWVGVGSGVGVGDICIIAARTRNYLEKSSKNESQDDANQTPRRRVDADFALPSALSWRHNSFK